MSGESVQVEQETRSSQQKLFFRVCFGPFSFFTLNERTKTRFVSVGMWATNTLEKSYTWFRGRVRQGKKRFRRWISTTSPLALSALRDPPWPSPTETRTINVFLHAPYARSRLLDLAKTVMIALRKSGLGLLLSLRTGRRGERLEHVQLQFTTRRASTQIWRHLKNQGWEVSFGFHEICENGSETMQEGEVGEESITSALLFMDLNSEMDEGKSNVVESVLQRLFSDLDRSPCQVEEPPHSVVKESWRELDPPPPPHILPTPFPGAGSKGNGLYSVAVGDGNILRPLPRFQPGSSLPSGRGRKNAGVSNTSPIKPGSPLQCGLLCFL